MKRNEHTSAAVASKAALLLSQTSALNAAVDLLEQCVKSLRKTAHAQTKIARSLAASALTQAPDRK